MQILYPAAKWRPLSSVDDEPSIGVPRILIFHTIVGRLADAESLFRRDGYTGDESTFGVGGSWDGNLDGVVYQWQRLDKQADAQYDGNLYATSIETSDGGDPKHPWSSKQLKALINLTVWWCKTTSNPCRPVTDPSQHGIGYHEQFFVWNRDHHVCPGPTREEQLRDIVIPQAAKILQTHVDPVNPPAPHPDPAPSFPAWTYPSADWMGITSSNPHNHSGFYPRDRALILEWQTQMRHRGWKISGGGIFDQSCADAARKFARQSNVRYKPRGGYGCVDSTLFKFAWTKALT